MTPKLGQGSVENSCFPLVLCTRVKQPAPLPVSELRQRNVAAKTPSVLNPVSSATARPPLAAGPPFPGRSSHSAPGGPPERNLSAGAAQQSLMRKTVTPGTPVPGVGELPAHRGTTS